MISYLKTYMHTYVFIYIVIENIWKHLLETINGGTSEKWGHGSGTLTEVFS